MGSEDENGPQRDIADANINLLNAQADLRKLQAAGLSSEEIHLEMIAFGFGNLTLKEFLAVKTVEQLVTLIEVRGKHLN